MGHEIVYCFNCQNRLTGVDFESGKVFRSQNKFCCERCARGLTDVEPVRREAPSTTRVRRTSTSRMAAVPPSPLPEPDPPKTRVPLIAGVAGAIILLSLILLGVLLSGGEEPDPPPVEDPPEIVKNETPQPPPTRESKGEAALKSALQFSEQNPANFEGAIRLLNQVVWDFEGTTVSKRATQERKKVEDARKKAFDPALAKLEKDAEAAALKEEFGPVAERLQKEHDRRDDPYWRLRVSGQQAALGRKAKERFDALRAEAERAVDGPDAIKRLQALRGRLVKWGLPDYVKRFDGEYTVEPAANVAPDAPKVRSAEAKAYAARWSAVMIQAARGDYDAAVAALKKEPAKETDTKKERAEDLKDLEAVRELERKGRGLARRIPFGWDVALEIRDASGGLSKLQGKVVSSTNDRIEIERGSGPSTAFVEPEELTANALVELLHQRMARKSPEYLRAAAIFCLLEGDAAAAEKHFGGAPVVPKKYLEFAKEARKHLAAADSADVREERRARQIYYAAERDYTDMKALGAAVEAYRQLLSDDTVGRKVVIDNVNRITQRAKVVEEYLYFADDLRGLGTFRRARHEEVGPVWMSSKDSEEFETQYNTLDVRFFAFPETHYRMWLYVGACCRETFEFFYQGTDVVTPDPDDRRMKLHVTVGFDGALPVPHRIYRLKKDHASHKGEKQPSRWEWVEIRIPKDAEAGFKHYRFMTNQRGFSIAAALISSTVTRPPKFEEIAERRKPARVLPGVKSALPSKGLAAFWNFELVNGAKVADASGQGNVGALKKGARVTAQKAPRGGDASLLLDSKGGHLIVPDAESLNVGTGSFTVATWLRLTDGEGGRLINKWSGNKGWLFDVNSKEGGAKSVGRVRFRVSDGKGNVDLVVAGKLDTKGKKWHHVAFVVDRDKATLRGYVDGQPLGRIESLAGVKESLSNSGAVGIGTLASKPDKYFGGYIDELRVYRRALPRREIQQLADR